MSYDYDFKTILKGALTRNDCSNKFKSIDAFNNDCMFAPFTNTNNNNDLECTTMSMMYNNDIGGINNDIGCKGNNSTSYNYDSLIDDKKKVDEVLNDNVSNCTENLVDSTNFFMQGSMKDNYKIVDNNFKEIAEKILLDINCDEDTLNKEVVNYNNNHNQQQNNNLECCNIKKVISMHNDINKKINLLHIEIDAIQALETNLQSIINNLEINNKTSSIKPIDNIEKKFKNNMNNVIYYNTYFKFIIHLKQQKNILEDNIDNEQLNLNAIMYLVMKHKWFETAPIVYKLLTK
jgi:hypothetical protein